MGDAFLSLLRLLDGWDRDLSARIALGERTRSGHYWFARVVAHLGDSWLWALISVWQLRDGSARIDKVGRLRRRHLSRWVLSLVAQAALTLMLKQLVQRRRPDLATFLYGKGPDEHSFPSGHAMRMAVIATWSTNLWPGWGWLLWLLTALIGWARVRLGIHYVGDVLAGWLLGAAIASLGRRGGGEGE